MTVSWTDINKLPLKSIVLVKRKADFNFGKQGKVVGLIYGGSPKYKVRIDGELYLYNAGALKIVEAGDGDHKKEFYKEMSQA